MALVHLLGIPSSLTLPVWSDWSIFVVLGDMFSIKVAQMHGEFLG